MMDFSQEEPSLGTQNIADTIYNINYISSSCKPFQRPPRTQHFFGREKEIDEITSNLKSGHPVTICGTAGIGKTALAAEVIWKIAPDDEPPTLFPDGIIFHSFYNQPSVNSAMESIALAFGKDPNPNPEAVARNALGGKKVLLFLDGMERAVGQDRLLDIAGNCGLIITSRNRSDAVSIRKDIAPLEIENSMKLLDRWSFNIEIYEKDSKDICMLVGNLPLAVRLVGRYLYETKVPVSNYLKWLQEAPLEALDPYSKKCHMNSVPRLIKKSLEGLSKDAKSIMGFAGQLALAPFKESITTDILRISTDKSILAFGELYRYGLLQRRDKKYEVSHALIHIFCREHIDVKKKDVIRRIITYYTDLAKTENKKGLVGYRNLDNELIHLIRVLDLALEYKKWDALRELVLAVGMLYGYLDMRGHIAHWQWFLKMGVLAARESRNRKDETAFLGNTGNTCRRIGKVKESIEYYNQAIDIAEIIRDRRAKGEWLGNLASAYSRLNQFDKAIEYFEEAIIIAREFRDEFNEVRWLGNLGVVYRRLNQWEEATEYTNQALCKAHTLESPRSMGLWLANLGVIYREREQNKAAIELFQRSLEIARKTEDRRSEVLRLWNLGLCYEKKDPSRAIEMMKYLVEYDREIEHPNAESHARRLYRIKAGISSPPGNP
ncbi:MAG: ATP-binding protein [Deltaproteobacteria bacterium]|nr:ATP-binding protein [Deltaproteobacteria bacterium]